MAFAHSVSRPPTIMIAYSPVATFLCSLAGFWVSLISVQTHVTLLQCIYYLYLVSRVKQPPKVKLTLLMGI